MPLGEFTITLRVTGTFRDERDAACKVKSIVEGAASCEQAEDRRFQRDHFTPGGGAGYSVSAPQIRKIEIV